VIEKRIEVISGLKVDIALTRALFDIKDFYEKAHHLLKEDGRLIMSKGPGIREEIERIEGRYRFEVHKIRLPLTEIYRNIVIIYPERDRQKNRLQASGGR
jgi:16S rRNA G527 N7-methylase RsmG